jgi:hypothetical protein
MEWELFSLGANELVAQQPLSRGEGANFGLATSPPQLVVVRFTPEAVLYSADTVFDGVYLIQGGMAKHVFE